MRIGCCSNMLYREPAPASDSRAVDPSGERLARTGIDYAERIARAGFDYIELPMAQTMALSEPEFETLLERLAASGLPCPTMNNLFPVHFRLTGPVVDDAAIDAYIEQAMIRAQRLGARHVVFGSGPAKSVPEGFPMEEGWRQVVRLTRRIAPIARAHDVTIAIEPLRRQESNLINTFAEGCRLARDVDDPNVRVLVDYYHLGTEREPVQHIIDNAGLLCHVHTARLERRGFPTTLDDDLNRDFYRTLLAVGYEGGISLEAYTDDFDREAPAALAFLREQTKSPRPA